MNRGNRQLPLIVAMVGGAFLVISLFIDWVSGPSLPGGAAGRLGLSKTGWELFHGTDVFLALLGIATIVYCLLWLLGVEQWPWLRAFVRWGGLIGLAIVLNYVIDQDIGPSVSSFSTDLGLGVFVALFASLAIFAGGLLLVRPDLAERVEEAASSIGQQAGGGEQPSTGQPSAGHPSAQGTGQAPFAQPAAASQPMAPAQPATPAQPAVPASPVVQPAAQQPQAPVAPQQPQAAITPEPPAAHPGPPAGWYPDPQGLARLRYWDGAAWTEQTSA